MFAIHELTILTITQQEVGVLAGVLNILAKYSAKIDKITFEGTKHLAYKIKDHNYGGFIFIRFMVSGEHNCKNICNEIQTHLDLNEDTLRYICVNVSERPFMKIFEKLNKKFYKEPIEAKVENEI